MEKYCLIIDDNKQDEIAEQIEAKAKIRGVFLKCLQFNVGSEERNDLLNEGRIDTQKVIDHFKAEFNGYKIDLICIDFQLEDDTINGLDVLKLIYEFRKSSQYMIYSSNLEQVAKGIIDSYDEDRDKTKLVNRIKSLTKFKVDFSARDRYDQAIVDIISRNEQNLDLLVEEKLLEYPDLIFKNTYPAFEGKTLLEIANEVRKGSVHGYRYKVEIIEQAIAHMVLINK